MLIRVEHGTGSINGSLSSVTINLSIAADISRAFVIFDYTSSQVNAEDAQCTPVLGQYSDGSMKLTVTRYGATDITNFSYSVISTQDQAFRVERGTVAFGIADTREGVLFDTGFTESRSFIIVNGRSAGNKTQHSDGICTAEFRLSGLGADIKRADTGVVATATYQAVEWASGEGVSVQSGETSLSGDMSDPEYVDQSITAVNDLTETWLYTSFRHESNGLAQTSVIAYMPDTSTVRYQRRSTNTSYQSYARYFVIEFPSPTVQVQHLIDLTDPTLPRMGIGESTLAVACDWVRRDQAFIWTTHAGSGTGTAFTQNRSVFEFNSRVEIGYTRYKTSQSLLHAPQVVYFTQEKSELSTSSTEKTMSASGSSEKSMSASSSTEKSIDSSSSTEKTMSSSSSTEKSIS